MGGSAHLLNLSENHTFRIDVPCGGRFILRVHRPGYQSAVAIDSELEWLAALRAQTDLRLPRVIPGGNGRLVQTLRPAGEAPRHAVMFAFEPGLEPQFGAGLVGLFETLGRYAAIAHRHALGFRPSPLFSRPVWNAAAILDPDGLWGDWRRAPGVTGTIASRLAALDAQLRARLATYGQEAGRFGLIHADMRLANLLVSGPDIAVIDFDDCGFGWFLFDIGASLSFIEHDPRVPALTGAWLRGYRSVLPLPADDEAEIPTFVLLRRLQLVSWVGSHRFADSALELGADFTQGACEMAERYLVTTSPP